MCETCGKPAIVHVASEAGGLGTLRHFCINCALAQESHARMTRSELNKDAIVILFGVALLSLSVLADWLELGKSQGWGYRQFIGLGMGLALVGTGAALRAMTVMFTGLVFVGLTVLADWLGLGSGGFGWQQITGTVVGAICIMTGVLLATRRRMGDMFQGPPPQ
jgi:hypothetical protein